MFLPYIPKFNFPVFSIRNFNHNSSNSFSTMIIEIALFVLLIVLIFLMDRKPQGLPPGETFFKIFAPRNYLLKFSKII